MLRARQNDSGAIGARRSSPDADPFVTPYVVQYLLEAKAAGYALPEGMLDEANGALRELAASGFDDLYLLRLRSWAVYLLTLQGEVTTNSLAAVQDTLQKRYGEGWKTDLSALYLASSYRLLKMDDEAAALLQPSWQQLSKAYDSARWTQNYFDPLVQDATRLYLITRHFLRRWRRSAAGAGEYGQGAERRALHHLLLRNEHSGAGKLLDLWRRNPPMRMPWASCR